jgi:hypothetical protein
LEALEALSKSLYLHQGKLGLPQDESADPKAMLGRVSVYLDLWFFIHPAASIGL